VSRRPRPPLPLALLVLALLLVAAASAGAESQPGGEAGKGNPAGAAPDVRSAPTPTPLPPAPQSAPNRPVVQTPPKPEEGPPADRGKPESAAPPAESKPEGAAPPAESKPESAVPPAESKPESAAPPAESKPEAGAPPKNLKPIAPEEAVGILGKKVYGPAGEDMGMVVEVLVDGDSRPRAAVVDFGGFLGVGSRKIAIDWELLQFRPADREQPVRLSLGRSEVQAAPEYKPSGQPAAVVAPPPSAHEPTPPDAEK
jgi:PRC-barrel domain